MSEATIFARATPPGRSAVAIVRISGNHAGEALRALCGRAPPPRRATVRTLRDPASGEVLDRALVLMLPGPGTASGEDTAELHLHGGRAVVAAVLAALGRLPGLRAAEPGEFARRAFLNGKLDLAAAEGLAALIEAETAAQRRQALSQADGHLGRAVEAWRDRLIELRALAEAAIDFSDEEDVGDPAAGLLPTIAALASEIDGALAGAKAGERLREGVTVVVAGRPNAGKSSLLNRLAGRDAAIVTEIPGTTRDLIEVQLDLSGMPVTLVDTAGMRETADLVEQEGVRRARRRAGSADLVLWVTDARAPDLPGEAELPPEMPVWVVRNKIDLADGGGVLRGAAGMQASGPDVTEQYGLPSRAFGAAGTTPSYCLVSSPAERSQGKGIQDTSLGAGSATEAASARIECTLPLSCATGEGLADLLRALEQRLADLVAGGETALVAEARQRRALEDAAGSLRAAECEQQPELLAENLRRATDSLGKITGRIDVEQVLDLVFSRFCIGK
jgi:tRNA modification GTPase